MYSIYSLTDPRDNLIHYIGISNNARLRLRQHMKETGTNRAKEMWVQELIANSLAPVMQIIATDLTFQDAQLQEDQLIRQYHKAGYPLTNVHGIKSRHLITVENGPTRKRTPEPELDLEFLRANPKKLLTIPDASRILGVSERAVRHRILKREVETIMVGGRHRFSLEALDRYLARNTKPEIDQK